MQRRDLLKRGSLGVAAAVSTGVSGCVGGGDGGDGGSGGDGGDGGSGGDGRDGGSGGDGGDGGSSGDGKSNDGGSGTGGSTTTDGGMTTTAGEPSVPGEVVRDSVEGLSVVGFDPDNSRSDAFRAVLTVENTGDKQVELSAHTWEMSTYDADGNDITGGNTGTVQSDEPAPGETGEVMLFQSYQRADATPADIARYEVSLFCDEYADEGYCQGQSSTTTGQEQTTTEREQTTTTSSGSSAPVYEFSEGESYTYEATLGDTTTEETWTVTAVDGDQITVERTTKSDSKTETATVTGTNETIYQKVSEARTIAFFPLLRGGREIAAQGEFTPGNSYTVPVERENAEWDTETVEVERETTVNGVTCTEATVSANGVDQETTICVAENYPFALTLTLVQRGETVVDMSLTDATRP